MVKETAMMALVDIVTSLKYGLRLLSVVSTDAWQCPTCGAWNHSQAEICCVCNNPKP